MKREEVDVAREALRAFLKRGGLRFTSVRREIVEEVFSRREHFDVRELMRRLRKKHRQISRASLYRTLGLLVSAGLLSRVDLGEGFSRYESRLGLMHHDHLLCLGCGKIIEFSSPRLEALQKEVCRVRSFRATGHSLQIKGYCRECARRLAGGRRSDFLFSCT